MKNFVGIIIVGIVSAFLGYQYGFSKAEENVRAEVMQSKIVQSLQGKLKAQQEVMKSFQEVSVETSLEEGEQKRKMLLITAGLIDTINKGCKDSEYIKRQLWKITEIEE